MIIIMALLLTSFMFAEGEEFRLGCKIEKDLAPWIHLAPPVVAEGVLRESVDLSGNFPPILSQGGQGSCTAWASGYYYKSYQEWQEHQWDLTDPNHQFSPAFVYNQINAGVDGGSNISDAFKVFASLGCATLQDMPYNDDICTLYPDESDFRHSMYYRTEETFALDLHNDLQSVKNTLFNGEPVVISISIYQSFYDIGSHDYVYGLNSMYGNMVGGHAICACGFDDAKPTPDGTGAMKFANSWGSGWGDDGYFWISYEALQNGIISGQYAYFATDRIDYQPELITVFHVTHDIRGAVGLHFGVGPDTDPLWSVPALNWGLKGTQSLAFPESNIAFDLTDGMNVFEFNDAEPAFMRAKDERYFWHRSPDHGFDGQGWWCGNPEIPGYGNGWNMDLDLPPLQLADSDNMFMFMMQYGIEDPADYGDFDGWDVANISISTNGGNNWDEIDGSLPYNVSNAWAYDWHGLGEGHPGWSGYSPEWQEIIFDLDEWAGEEILLRIKFISDGGWCSYDNTDYFGLAVDNLMVIADGVEIYFDDAEAPGRTEGSIDYFTLERIDDGYVSISADTPATIPENESYVFVHAQYDEVLVGDSNQDGILNILDVVILVNHVMDMIDPDPQELLWEDMNADGIIDVLDVVALVYNIMLV